MSGACALHRFHSVEHLAVQSTTDPLSPRAMGRRRAGLKLRIVLHVVAEGYLRHSTSYGQETCRPEDQESNTRCSGGVLAVFSAVAEAIVSYLNKYAMRLATP